MTVPISNVPRRVVLVASGTGPYSFNFEILEETDISVYLDDLLLTITSDYTVVINENGTGYVTLTAEPTGATQVSIVGDRSIERSTDFTTGGDLFAVVLNEELDSQTIFAQQNAEAVTRALKAPETDPLTINMTLPRLADRAGKYLGFDENGNPDVGVSITDVTGVLAIEDEIIALSNISAEIVTVAGIEQEVIDVANVSSDIAVLAPKATQIGVIGDDLAGTGWSYDLGLVSDGTVEVPAATPDGYIIGVYNSLDDIETVADNIANVNAIAPSIENVNAVAAEVGTDGSITEVAGNLSDISTVAGEISPVNNIATVAGIAGDIALAAQIDAADLATVAAISTDVTTVAGVSTDVTTVAGISTDVTAVASNETNIDLVAGDITNVSAVGNSIANVNAVAAEVGTDGAITDVAANLADISAVADISTDVTTVAGIAPNVTTVAGVSTDVTTVAGVAANVTTVAGISSNVTTVAGISTNVTTVAGISTDVTTVAGDSADIQLLADNIGTISAKANAGANSDITSLSGLTTPLSPGQGGTGQSTYTDGQLLIGNTSGNTLSKSTLTAGANITITNGAGSITIAATSGGISDGDKGDITVSSSGAVWTIDNNVVTVDKLATTLDLGSIA